MKKILLLIILYSTFSKSQNIFSLKSSDDDLPIKYAHIFANNKIISSSDSLGNFIINKNHLNSIIKITALGYKTLDSVKLNNSLTVFMEVEPIVLNEIVVNNKNKKLYPNNRRCRQAMKNPWPPTTLRDEGLWV